MCSCGAGMTCTQSCPWLLTVQALIGVVPGMSGICDTLLLWTSRTPLVGASCCLSLKPIHTLSTLALPF